MAGAIELPDLSGQSRSLAPQFLGTVGRTPDRGVFQFPTDFF
jgi:hypothetical protein